MAERLGIVSRYNQHDTTNAAIILANLAYTSGIPVSILARGACDRTVSRDWDADVVDERKTCVYTWLRRCSRVIWTAIPDADELRIAKQMGIATHLLLNWEEITPAHGEALAEFDKIIMPYRCAGHALQRRWEIKDARGIVMPWDVSVPFTHRSVLARPGVNAYFPLYDSQPHRTDQAVFTMMRRALDEVKDAKVTVGVGKRWAMSSRRFIRKLRKEYPERVQVLDRPGVLERLDAFAKADITVWAPRFESFALVGLTSLCMGTPVLSWDIRPQNEYLVAWKNAVLVPCPVTENWLGVPEVTGGYTAFGETLVGVLKDKALIGKLRLATAYGLDTRRKQFIAGWRELVK